MSKKTLLSALLISSFSLSTVFAAAAADLTSATATACAETTMLTFTANAKAQEAPTKKVLGISKQDCPTFPFTRTAEKNYEEILIKKVTLGAIDPWFYQNNPALKIVSFEGSTIDLAPFEGHTFLAGCDAITTVSFKSTEGVKLDDFIRKYASKTLLARILARQCILIFSPESDGATMANFVTNDKIPVVNQNTIHLLIKSSNILGNIEAVEKTTSAAAAAAPAPAAEAASQRGLLNRMTWGLLGQ